MSEEKNSIFTDIFQGIGLSFKVNYQTLLHNYVMIPVGCLLDLCLLYGVNEVIKKIKIDFPASVALMLILYCFLLLSVTFFGKNFTNKLIKVIQVPSNFALKWINLFFLPGFVTLPLSDAISIKEAMIIAAVFVVGLVATFAGVGLFVKYFQVFMNQTRRSGVETAEELSDIHTENSQLSSRVRGNSLEVETIELEPLQFPNKALDKHPADNTRVLQIEQEAREDQMRQQQFSQYLATLPTRSKQISNVIVTYFDWAVYSVLVVVGIPIYFALDYSLPYQLGISVLFFKIALLVPNKWKKICHPILVSFPFMLLVFYIFALIKKQKFLDSLRHYKTGRNYLNLFGSHTIDLWPGAGDVLTALMDISIVSLALPMFNYREDLRKHYIAFVPPILLSTAGSFFIYPPLCHAIGISPARSLGFVGRSVTLALGTPLTKSLEGSVPLMSVCTILSGIIGVLCGDYVLKTLLRVKDDDYITIGITFGINCGAISTAHLLISNPRAGAISSLSFSIFGTLMVILGVIKPVAHIIQGWAGMN